MENSEQQIAVTEKMFDYPNTYNFYWTSKRLVAINVRRQEVVGVGLVSGLIGEALTKFNESRKKEKTKNLTLDEILAKDKTCFAVPYEAIEQIKLCDPQSRWKSRKLEISSEQFSKMSMTYNRWKKFVMSKEQFEQLSTLLPSITALKGKLVS